jgi:hypothetical protein
MEERCKREEKVGGGKVFVVGEGRAGDLGDCLLGGCRFGSEKPGGKAGCDKRDSDTHFC